MITLKCSWEDILREQDVFDPPEEAADKVVEFPKENFTVSFIDREKKLIYSPIKGEYAPHMKTYISRLKQGRKIAKIISKGKTVEVHADPREDFNLVKDFVTQEVSRD